MKMTPERKDLIKFSKAAAKQRLAGQTIKLGHGWTIVRFDPLNWQIRHNGKCPNNRDNYYGTLFVALSDLPEKVIRAAVEDKNAIAEVWTILQAIRADIQKALLCN